MGVKATPWQKVTECSVGAEGVGLTVTDTLATGDVQPFSLHVAVKMALDVGEIVIFRPTSAVDQVTIPLQLSAVSTQTPSLQIVTADAESIGAIGVRGFWLLLNEAMGDSQIADPRNSPNCPE